MQHSNEVKESPTPLKTKYENLSPEFTILYNYIHRYIYKYIYFKLWSDTHELRL